ncbi:hypothetical protein OAS93_00470 [Gammaproteobacteria bacterium]|nr:hypothetical protein [Gammaproteobacteria bacterium]MDC1099748.1 hypothetical protein [Gammaproteobacteria bacterium]
MITFLGFLYIFSAFAYFYSNKSGYSLLRYMWKRKNINIYLSTELVFLIITSFIVFTNQPLNWIVAILMFMHFLGIAWLIANPNNFYEMAEDSINLDASFLENVVVITFLIYAGMALFSRIIF